MSLENSYDFYNDGICNIPTGYDVRNAYGAFYKKPTVGQRNIALYSDNFLVGYTGVTPPTDGGLIKGNVAIGKNSAECALDVEGGLRASGKAFLTETIDSDTALSTTKDSIIDARAAARGVTLANAGLVDQVKNVKLLSRASRTATITTPRGSFQLNAGEPSKTLRYRPDGWEIESAENKTESFYTTIQNTVYNSSSASIAGTFGICSAMSSDGLTIVIGASIDNSSEGAAYVFTRTVGTSTWALEQKLVGTGDVGAAQQGASVAISADGNTVAMGGPADNTNVGAVWIFTRTAGVWTQSGSKLVGTGNSGACQQGYKVALSADGTILASGGYADNTNVGAVWIFQISEGWAQVGSKLVGSGNTGACRQGASLALSADGNTLVVGGNTDDTNIGALWIYYGGPGSYAAEASALKVSDNTGTARVGTSVAISADGNTVVTGGSTNDSSAGASWVFTRSVSTWTQYGLKLVGDSAIGAAQQGSGIAISSDGKRFAVLGAVDNTNIGAAWNFALINGKWVQINKLVPSGGSSNAGSIAMNSNGANLLVTSYSYSGYTGKFYVFN